MPDHGMRYADRKIKKVDRELQGIYRQAEKELTKKLADFVAKSKEQDRFKQKQRDAGIITEAEYESWLKGQVFQKKRWEAKVKQVQQVMFNHNVEAAKIVHENKMDVFAENYNREAFHAEAVTGISFDIYNTQAVAQLIEDRPDLLPEWKIDEEKDYNWNYRKVNNAITQGIIQGESVEKVMKRLCDNLCTQNENKMRMFARTAINGAQNAGRQAQMEQSAKKGIEVYKQWVATLDNRTRDTHRHLDGEEVPYNEPFDSDLGEIRFPSDPHADPANTFNCRCRIVTVYPKYRDEEENWRENETIDGMTYQEWKENKKKPNEAENEPSALEQKLAGIARGKPMSHDEADTGRVNPNYMKGAGYRINCQSCVVAYEARRRGYNIEVVANDKDHPMCKKLAMNTRLAWKDKATGQTPDFMFPYKPTLYTHWQGEPPTPKRFKALLQENIQEDARYHLGFGWKGASRSGHIVTLGKKDGSLFIYDPQCDKTFTGSAFDQYLTRLKMQRTSYGYKYYQYPEVMRVDDKDFDFDVVNQIVKGIGE